MAAHDTRTRPLEGHGSEERLIRLRNRFRAAAPRARLWPRVRGRVGDLGRSLLIVYWLGCVVVIAVGANRIYPDLWPRVQRVLPGPKVDQPFPSCRAAHAAGVYNIPIWSPGYASEQDGDGDGRACEPQRSKWNFQAAPNIRQ
ncbi:excalibur calcium-binding domain-containing protein [Phenylobacterium sp.]|uniref:excalibur calcium-binding domain-containing protein n=1 Tax=Phenylobacterium sp. TaxID=1871053 RepID=UPI0027374E80|nr:excalibur calcium-binding domain-containing protein [Phenylobacterium sp.]MDP3635155.1 excalibur calcium-binding domain-containing protein [Phenylobacterium sp.]